MKTFKMRSLIFAGLFSTIGISGFSQQAIFENDTFRIERVNTGYEGPGMGFFSGVCINKTNQVRMLGLDLSADPVFGLRRSQKQFIYRLLPKEEKVIEGDYFLSMITSQAFLRVRFGIPVVTANGPEFRNYFCTEKIPIEEQDPDLCFDLKYFTDKLTDHFHIYGYKGSLSEKNLDQIAQMREGGFQKISAQLNAAPAEKITLIFYPDGSSKKAATGHTGSGLARGNCIIEIYNESIKLNPYHETAHIIMSQLGNPPALFHEGFAVYISEELGADESVPGGPGKKSCEVTAANLKNNNLIPLSELFSFVEIGSDASRYAVSYPEAASFVRFLIKNYGQEKFRTAITSLINTPDKAQIESNRRNFEEIYNASLTDLEKLWLASLQ